MDGLRLVGIDELDRQRQRHVERIYTDGFPPQERAPFDSLRADRFLVAVSGEGTPVGLAVTRDLGTSELVFLRYYVVEGRGRGTGTAVWALLREDAGSRRPFLALDVEDPEEDGVGDDEREQRRRRIRFYERNGVALLPVLGYRPDHDGTPLALRLMLADLRRPTAQPTPIPSADVLRDVVLTVFRERYGAGPDHPDVVACLTASGLG